MSRFIVQHVSLERRTCSVKKVEADTYYDAYWKGLDGKESTTEEKKEKEFERQTTQEHTTMKQDGVMIIEYSHSFVTVIKI